MKGFICGNVWLDLRAAVERSNRPAAVAVAYFGKGATKLLPLPKGSRLVVDASEAAIKSGQTCPAELKQLLLKRESRVYSVSNLHAKVFVVGSTAFIGSSNASNHSANNLIEALVATTNPQVVKAARSFIRSICLQELGPQELDRLQGIYRPPRFGAARKSPGTRKRRSPLLDPLRIVHLERKDPPDGSEEVQQTGTTIAKKRMTNPRKAALDNFFWKGKCPFHDGDNVIEIVEELSGRHLVDRPARVVHTESWLKGAMKYTFVYVERPKKRRVEIGRLAKRIGRGARAKLQRSGVVRKDFAERLLRAWSSSGHKL